MVVTHLSQILGFVAMDAPARLDAGALRDAKAAAFADVMPFAPADAAFGQFEGYRDDDGVAPDSKVDTFAALRVTIDKRPLARRALPAAHGKAMAATRRTVTITLHEPEHRIFEDGGVAARRPNELVFELTDDPQIAVELRVKVPGPTFALTRAPLTLDVERALSGRKGLEAYERLFHDVMLGDQLLFTRADEVECLWECAAPLLADSPELLPYAKGSWGPDAASALAAPLGWRLAEDGR